MLWSDEFDGDAINADIWEHEVNCWGGGNNELQCYTDEPANSYVSDGSLHLVAIRGAQNYCGPAHNQDDPNYNPEDESSCKPYTSARLRTKGKEDITYGRIEVRAKTPFGKGLWPAIWMLPTNYEYGGWPHSGEIDIFEAFSPGTDDFNELNEIAGTLHYGFSWPWNQYTGKDSPGATFTPETNIWEEFHTYAVEWEEEEIRWYVDGNHYGTQTSDGWFSYYWGGQELGYQNSVGAQPFDKAFHLLLNVAVGGVPGTPEQDAVFPQAMEVEFVRVYQCSVDPVTGKGCATINPDVTPVAGHTPPTTTREEIYLFQNGVKTLTFELDDVQVDNTLQHGEWSDGNNGALNSNPAAAPIDSDSDATVVWDLNYNNAGVAVAWLASADMTGVDGVVDGFSFGADQLHNRARQVGEYKFDIWVESAAANAKLVVKLGSGYPDIGIEEVALTQEMVGQWTPVSVRFYSLRQAPGSQSTVNWSSVIRPIEVEILGGAAHIQLDNVRIVCLEDCDMEPKPAPVPPVVLTETFDIFADGAVDPVWDFGIGHWDNETEHVTTSLVRDEDRDRDVLQVNFSASATNGLAYIQATTGRNVSAFAADGQLVFDIKVLSYGGNTNGLVVKIESGPSTGTGDWVITPTPPVGEWTTVTLDIADMIAAAGTNGNFNMAAVNTPFVFLPAWGNQSGVQVQLDNIRWVLP